MAEENPKSHENYLLVCLREDFYTNIFRRFHEITDPYDCEDLVYTYYLVEQKLLCWTNELSPAQKQEVLDSYKRWYTWWDIDSPHMEWVERKRKK